MIKLQRNGIRWELLPDCRSLLEQLAADSGVAVKQTPTKLVTVHRIDNRRFYVKRYLNATKPLRRLKYLVKPSKAKQEWRLAQRFEALAIPLVRHLAFGERWTAGGLRECLLVTEAFDGVELSHSSVHQTLEVQVALAGFLRHMHDRGVLQPDLHHNILVRVDPVELRRVDLGNARLKTAVTEAERIENLAWFNVNVTLTDAFFDAYGAPPEFVGKVRQRSRIMRRESREKNSWRSLRHGLFFAPVRRGKLTWWVRKEFLDDTLRSVLEDPAHPPSEVIVQRFVTARMARHAYRTAYHLELVGVSTPRPMAAASRYVLTQRIAGAVSLAEHLRAAQRLDEALLGRVAALLARLHVEGFAATVPLRARNFLVHPDGEVSVVPALELRYHHIVSAATAAEDARALTGDIRQHPSVTRANLDAFLQVYLEQRAST